MAKILQMSEAASIALHALIFLAQQPEKTTTVKEIALQLEASEAHVAKVVPRLAKAGLLHSERGPKGGVRLARSVSDISYLEIFEAVEGPLHSGGCIFEKTRCPYGGCIFGGFLDDLSEQIREKFASTRLGDYWKSSKGEQNGNS